ncbi:hypothetical protein FRC03_001843 [Tulasnella sp. 419]|nr:hypothetical protein FRC03_001843 [Tulasnella sp. 419]
MSNFYLPESTTLVALDFLMKRIQVSEPRVILKQGLIESMEDQINRMALAAEAFRVAANNQLKLNRRRRNAVASPIFRCPDEILVLILELLLASSTHNDELENIRLVCYRWYQVVQSTPSIWSYIYITHQSKPDKIGTQIAKSQAIPLSIIMDRYRYYDNEIFDILFDHIPRWGTVTLNINPQPDDPLYDSINPGGWMSPEPLPDFSCLAGKPAPFLREFVLEVGHIYPGTALLPMNLFGGHAPLLQRLHIPFFNISWDNPILSGLTSLNIYAWDGLQRPSAEQYVRLLDSCPGLEHLTIQGRGGLLGNDHALFQRNLNLPRLTRLHLLNMEPVTIRSIISSIKASPECASFWICNLPSADAQTIIRSTFLDFNHSSILISPSTIHTLSFSMRHGYLIQLEAISEKEDGRIAERIFACDDIANTFLFTSLLISSHQRQHLYQNPGNGGSVDGGAIPLQLFEEFTGVKELRLSGFMAYITILPLLGRPMDVPAAGSNIPAWLCPKLRKLHVTIGDADIQILLDFAKSRYSHVSGFHPEKLERQEISISSSHKDFSWEQEEIERGIRDVAEVVGNDVVNVIGTWPPLRTPLHPLLMAGR